MRERSAGTLGSGLMLAAALAFALAGALCVYAKGEMSAWQLVLVRSGMFLLLLLPWVVRHQDQAKGNDHKGLVIRGVAGTFMPLLQFYAFFELPAAVAMTLARSVPLWVILVGFAWKGWRPQPRELLAIAVAAVGVALVYHPSPGATPDSSYAFGIAAGLGCSLSQAIAFIQMRELRQTDSVATINLWLAIIGLLVSAPFALSRSWTSEPVMWTNAILVGAFMFVGQLSQTRALQILRPAIASTLSLVASVVFAAILGLVLFDQQPTVREIIGLAVVITAGGVAAFAARVPAAGASA